MIMQKILHSMLVVLMIVLAYTSNAQAYPTLTAGTTDIKFFNYENMVDNPTDTVANGLKNVISVGDIFYGIASAQTFTEAGAATQYWSATSTDNLASYFVLEVKDVSLISGDSYKITFGAITSASQDPNGVFTDADVLNGVVEKLYYDNKALTFGSSVAADVLSVIDGSAYATLTLTGTSYWFGIGFINPTLATTNYLSTNFWGLDSLSSFGNINPVLITNPALSSTVLSEVVGESTIIKNRDNTVWTYKSTDPFRVTTPEPTTILIVGSGLIGLFAIRRRGKRN